MSNGNGGGGGFDFGGLFDGLLGALAAIIQAIINFLVALVNVLVEILNFLYQGEQGIFDFTQKGDLSVWRAFKNLLDDALHIRILKSLQDLRDLYEKLRKWIAKLKGWLDRLRRIQQLYQVQALKRFINLIQRIRQVLVIFRLLHLKFASKLDAWLAGIEGKLISRVADYGRKTNEIIAWLNVVADPLQAWRKGLLFGSYGRMIGGLSTAIGALGLQTFFPFLTQTIGPGVPTRPWADVVAQFHEEVQRNSGDWAGFKAQSLQYRTLLDQGFTTKSPS